MVTGCYGPDGRPVDAAEAEELLRSPTALMVARTVLTTGCGRIEVSTVFLVIDHDFFGEGPPVLWQTVTFGGPTDGMTDRYVSVADALAGHADHVAVCQAVLDRAGVEVVAVEQLEGPAAKVDPAG